MNLVNPQINLPNDPCIPPKPLPRTLFFNPKKNNDSDPTDTSRNLEISKKDGIKEVKEPLKQDEKSITKSRSPFLSTENGPSCRNSFYPKLSLNEFNISNEYLTSLPSGDDLDYKNKNKIHNKGKSRSMITLNCPNLTLTPNDCTSNSLNSAVSSLSLESSSDLDKSTGSGNHLNHLEMNTQELKYESEISPPPPEGRPLIKSKSKPDISTNSNLSYRKHTNSSFIKSISRRKMPLSPKNTPKSKLNTHVSQSSNDSASKNNDLNTYDCLERNKVSQTSSKVSKENGVNKSALDYENEPIIVQINHSAQGEDDTNSTTNNLNCKNIRDNSSNINENKGNSTSVSPENVVKKSKARYKDIPHLKLSKNTEKQNCSSPGHQQSSTPDDSSSNKSPFSIQSSISNISNKIGIGPLKKYTKYNFSKKTKTEETGIQTSSQKTHSHERSGRDYSRSSSSQRSRQNERSNSGTKNNSRSKSSSRVESVQRENEASSRSRRPQEVRRTPENQRNSRGNRTVSSPTRENSRINSRSNNGGNRESRNRNHVRSPEMHRYSHTHRTAATSASEREVPPSYRVMRTVHALSPDRRPSRTKIPLKNLNDFKIAYDKITAHLNQGHELLYEGKYTKASEEFENSLKLMDCILEVSVDRLQLSVLDTALCKSIQDVLKTERKRALESFSDAQAGVLHPRNVPLDIPDGAPPSYNEVLKEDLNKSFNGKHLTKEIDEPENNKILSPTRVTRTCSNSFSHFEGGNPFLERGEMTEECDPTRSHLERRTYKRGTSFNESYISSNNGKLELSTSSSVVTRQHSIPLDLTLNIPVEHSFQDFLAETTLVVEPTDGTQCGKVRAKVPNLISTKASSNESNSRCERIQKEFALESSSKVFENDINQNLKSQNGICGASPLPLTTSSHFYEKFDSPSKLTVHSPIYANISSLLTNENCYSKVSEPNTPFSNPVKGGSRKTQPLLPNGPSKPGHNPHESNISNQPNVSSVKSATATSPFAHNSPFLPPPIPSITNQKTPHTFFQSNVSVFPPDVCPDHVTQFPDMESNSYISSKRGKEETDTVTPAMPKRIESAPVPKPRTKFSSPHARPRKSEQITPNKPISLNLKVLEMDDVNRDLLEKENRGEYSLNGDQNYRNVKPDGRQIYENVQQLRAKSVSTVKPGFTLPEEISSPNNCPLKDGSFSKEEHKENQIGSFAHVSSAPLLNQISRRKSTEDTLILQKSHHANFLEHINDTKVASIRNKNYSECTEKINYPSPLKVPPSQNLGNHRSSQVPLKGDNESIFTNLKSVKMYPYSTNTTNETATESYYLPMNGSRLNTSTNIDTTDTYCEMKSSQPKLSTRISVLKEFDPLKTNDSLEPSDSKRNDDETTVNKIDSKYISEKILQIEILERNCKVSANFDKRKDSLCDIDKTDRKSSIKDEETRSETSECPSCGSKMSTKEIEEELSSPVSQPDSRKNSSDVSQSQSLNLLNEANQSAQYFSREKVDASTDIASSNCIPSNTEPRDQSRDSDRDSLTSFDSYNRFEEGFKKGLRSLSALKLPSSKNKEPDEDQSVTIGQSEFYVRDSENCEKPLWREILSIEEIKFFSIEKEIGVVSSPLDRPTLVVLEEVSERNSVTPSVFRLSVDPKGAGEPLWCHDLSRNSTRVLKTISGAFIFSEKDEEYVGVKFSLKTKYSKIAKLTSILSSKATFDKEVIRTYEGKREPSKTKQAWKSFDGLVGDKMEQIRFTAKDVSRHSVRTIKLAKNAISNLKDQSSQQKFVEPDTKEIGGDLGKLQEAAKFLEKIIHENKIKYH